MQFKMIDVPIDTLTDAPTDAPTDAASGVLTYNLKVAVTDTQRDALIDD